MKTYRKDPDEKLDYEIDWSDFVETADSIISSVWSVESGLTKVSSSNTTDTTTVWLEGGTIDETYVATNSIVTNDGREAERKFAILITEWQGIATLAEVAIICGQSASAIDCTWLSLADEYVKLILNRNFNGILTGTQYEDTVNKNDYYQNYDGQRKFVLKQPNIVSVSSVVYQPDSTSPETLVEDTDYYVNLVEGVVELDSDFDPVIGQRTFKFTYTYGYERPPTVVVSFANLYAAFLLESNPAKNEDSVPLAEVEIGRYREKYATASSALKAKYSKLGRMEELIINKYRIWD